MFRFEKMENSTFLRCRWFQSGQRLEFTTELLFFLTATDLGSSWSQDRMQLSVFQNWPPFWNQCSCVSHSSVLCQHHDDCGIVGGCDSVGTSVPPPRSAWRENAKMGMLKSGFMLKPPLRTCQPQCLYKTTCETLCIQKILQICCCIIIVKPSTWR